MLSTTLHKHLLGNYIISVKKSILQSIIIRFDRSTGALKVKDDSDPSKVIGAHRIWIRQKGNKSKVYTVTIHQETGKIEVDADEVKNSP